jgi:hypothetical protein
VLDATGVEGAFVFTFISPNSAYNDDPYWRKSLISELIMVSISSAPIEESGSNPAGLPQF